MARYLATVAWQRNGADFTDNRYSRAHAWRFDGGTNVPASSSPHLVPAPLSDATGVDPEEAFVASLSSCHMLTFLSMAAKRGFVVDDYRDDAEGWLGRSLAGKLAMTRVTLRPSVTYANDAGPSPEENEELHHAAHEECFIANSVSTEVRVIPSMKTSDRQKMR